MSGTSNHAPEGFHTVAPYLICRGAGKALDFYKRVFGAVESSEPMRDPEGRVMHAQLTIGDSQLMLADEAPDAGIRSPETVGGSPVLITVHVADVDEVHDRAAAAGAKVIRQPETQFYGQRNCKLEDPFGHLWIVSTHVEDVSPEEIKRRAAELYGDG